MVHRRREAWLRGKYLGGGVLFGVAGMVHNCAFRRTAPEAKGLSMDETNWLVSIVDHIQEVLDRSAASATSEVGRVFSRDDWRLPAGQFLEFWAAQRICTVTSVGPRGQPHIAVVHAGFGDDGRLTMRMYTGSIRAKDFLTNSRVALSKNLDGAVAMVYGRARVVPGTEAVRQAAETVEVEIAITRIYAMKPRMG